MNNKQKLIAPAAKPIHLIGHYTFDDICIDTSGSANHATMCPGDPGPSIFISGQSSRVTDKSVIKIPHAQIYEDALDITYTFWMYILNMHVDENTQSGSINCAILTKGNEKDGVGPGLTINVLDGSMKASKGESFLLSNAHLTTKRWNHIGLIV